MGNVKISSTQRVHVKRVTGVAECISYSPDPIERKGSEGEYIYISHKKVGYKNNAVSKTSLPSDGKSL